MKMLKLVVGMPGVRILGVEATPAVIRIEVESTDDETVCPRCGAQAVREALSRASHIEHPAISLSPHRAQPHHCSSGDTLLPNHPDRHRSAERCVGLGLPPALSVSGF